MRSLRLSGFSNCFYGHNRADFEAMKKTFSGIEFEYADPNSASDINDDWNLWRDTFLDIAEQYVPRKTVKGRYIIHHG